MPEEVEILSVKDSQGGGEMLTYQPAILFLRSEPCQNTTDFSARIAKEKVGQCSAQFGVVRPIFTLCGLYQEPTFVGFRNICT
jgi:hypothetical protein